MSNKEGEILKIGIIGLGAVGEAVYEALKSFHYSVSAYDINAKLFSSLKVHKHQTGKML